MGKLLRHTKRQSERLQLQGSKKTSRKGKGMAEKETVFLPLSGIWRGRIWKVRLVPKSHSAGA